jgi:hypothetical protein
MMHHLANAARPLLRPLGSGREGARACAAAAAQLTAHLTSGNSPEERTLR